MSQLILLRQRIKAIETIKKITHAMRLISMSSHAHLKNKQGSSETYAAHLKLLLSKIKQKTQINSNETAQKSIKRERVLICVVSSQKGLCGTFNTNLLNYCNTTLKTFNSADFSLFLIGKKIIDSLTPLYQQQIIGTIPNFSVRTIPEIMITLQKEISAFDRVIIVHNVLKSFFLQKPQATTILPLELPLHETQTDDLSEYLWEIDAQTIFDELIKEHLHTYLEYTLFQSLLAEHAARFIAMDNSTRNAHKLLEEKKIEYNKLRQAKITKELTELSSLFTL